MGNRDHDDIVDNIKTLDEAKQIILQLLESQEAINNALGYELRTPLTTIKGYTEMLQRDDLAQEHPYILKTIIQITERIARMIEALWIESRVEMFQLQKSLLENYPIETVNLNPILIDDISRIQKNIDLENEKRVLENERNQKKDNAKPIKPLVDFSVQIDENLPTVQFSVSILNFVMFDINWLLSDYYRDNIFITTDFDDEWVRITFGYSTESLLTQILDDFKQFENARSSHQFYAESLFLYEIWLKLKTYGGELSLDVQDKNDTDHKSRLRATVSLKRSQ